MDLKGSEDFVPLDDAPASSQSRSTRSTARQTEFRIALAARDSRCVVTGAPWSDCIASHIVPFSRLDVYQNIYIPDISENNLFLPCMGLMLVDNFSRTFDRFKWSVYCRDGKYLFHGPDIAPEYMKCHGKLVNVADGRKWNPSEMPDPIFCQWHWEQCMKAHARGFAIWPSLEEITQEHNNSIIPTGAPETEASGRINRQRKRGRSVKKGANRGQD